jgi:cis-2,3-dihydrobiphenyl-2,3-diol dehydrogenase
MAWLKGKVALITGGASGLGLAIARRFVQEGAAVGVLDVSESKLEALRREIPDAVCVPGDVRNPDHNSQAIAQLVSQHGRLDILVGNAGIWDYSTRLVDLPDDKIDAAFDEVVGINVKGYLLGAKAAVPHLVRSRGTMIFTVSNAGFYAGGGGPLYTLSKHAVVGLICQLAHELAPVVRVNGVAPGAVPSDLRGPRALGLADKSIQGFDMRSVAERIMPLPIVPEPADQSGAYVYLASAENSRAVTGIVINSDCGIGARGLWSVRGGDDLLERFGALAEY